MSTVRLYVLWQAGSDLTSAIAYVTLFLPG